MAEPITVGSGVRLLLRHKFGIVKAIEGRHARVQLRGGKTEWHQLEDLEDAGAWSKRRSQEVRERRQAERRLERMRW